MNMNELKKSFESWYLVTFPDRKDKLKDFDNGYSDEITNSAWMGFIGASMLAFKLLNKFDN